MNPTYSPACRSAVGDLLRAGGPLTSYRANPLIGVGPKEGSYAWRLEREIERRFRVRHAVACSSGTAALHVALEAIGVRHGEVIVPAISFSASAAAIVLAGGRPCFVDVDPKDYLASYRDVKNAITKKTRAILPVHLFGNLAETGKLASLGLPVVEDACQAVGCTRAGAFSGTIGMAGAYSFGSCKQVPAGEGGCIVTNSDSLARCARLLINHAENFGVDFVGYNYRMPEQVAAVALHGLWVLKDNTLFATPYRVKKRGPENKPYIETPLHQMPAFKKYAKGPLPIAEDLCKRSLCIR